METERHEQRQGHEKVVWVPRKISIDWCCVRIWKCCDDSFRLLCFFCEWKGKGWKRASARGPRQFKDSQRVSLYSCWGVYKLSYQKVWWLHIMCYDRHTSLSHGMLLCFKKLSPQKENKSFTRTFYDEIAWIFFVCVAARCYCSVMMSCFLFKTETESFMILWHFCERVSCRWKGKKGE